MRSSSSTSRPTGTTHSTCCGRAIPACHNAAGAAPWVRAEATFGAGFSSISTDHWPTLATDPDPPQGYVHEWLHQVEAVYRALGLDEGVLPNLHAAGDFTSTRRSDEPPFGFSYAAYHDGTGTGRAPARTWSPWYRDWMTGRLRRVDTTTAPTAPIGLTPERWALRRIRRG